MKDKGTKKEGRKLKDKHNWSFQVKLSKVWSKKWGKQGKNKIDNEEKSSQNKANKRKNKEKKNKISKFKTVPS